MNLSPENCTIGVVLTPGQKAGLLVKFGTGQDHAAISFESVFHPCLSVAK